MKINYLEGHLSMSEAMRDSIWILFRIPVLTGVAIKYNYLIFIIEDTLS